MSVGGGVPPSVLDTLEFPAALERVAVHAVSPLGAARVRARTPATDRDAIRESLAQVAELAARIIADDSIRAEPVPDIGPALELLAVPGSALEGPALANVGRALAAARVVGAELGHLAALAPRSAALRVPLPPKELETRLSEGLDPDGTVRDGASKDLARARQAVRETRQRLVANLEAILARLDQRERAPDAGVTLRGGRYVIPVRGTARSQLGGIVHDESASGTTLFVEPPEAIALGNELRAHEVQEQREVRRVLREITERLRPQREAIAAAWDMCIAFDDLCARGRYAIEGNGWPPAMGEGPLVIRAGRHPLLVSSPPDPLSLSGEGARKAAVVPPLRMAERGSGGEGTEGGSGRLAVPFDLTLAPDEFTLLVSGPNTGGKTVLIKAVGLICLLAQSGVVPPVGPESQLPVFHDVFADIGDRQSISASLSTFSAHVAALRDILERAGATSLVLLDELGGDTDPAEGAALAAAVLRTLTRRRAVTLATTHLGALKQLAAQTVGIVNASLQFDAETLTPTYRLLKGVPGRSYGLAIARRLGVGAEVLAEAERALPDAERALDALLASVEQGARELELRAREQEATAEQLGARAAALESRAATLATREREVAERAGALEREARAHARSYLLEARRRVEEALAAARAAVDEATAREARRLVEKAIERTEDETAEAGKGKGEGWLSLDDLKRQRQPPAPARPPDRPTAAFPTTAVSTEVSLRGMRLDEAEGQLLKALDDAVLAELPYLRVIHGKGTGAVRKLVHGILAHDARVKRFALAPPNQGGAGVTIVEFRA